jgi:PAS domain S-box-containing protein
MKQKGWLLIGLPMIFQLAFVSVMSYSFYESQQSYAEQVHNRAVNRDAIRLAMPYFNLLVKLRQHSPADVSIQDCDEVNKEVSERLEEFHKTVTGDDLAVSYYQRIVRFMRVTLLPLTRQVRRAAETGAIRREVLSDHFADSIVLYNTQLSAGIFKLCDACEQRDKDTPARLKQFRELETNALYAALAASVLAAGWLAFYFSADVVRRLIVLSDNSQRLASGMPLNPPISGSDEIAQLDKSFHETALRLEEARATESSFLDNANNIICSLNTDGSFVTLNRAAAAKLNMPADELNERKLHALISEQQSSQLNETLAEAKASLQPQSIELRLDTGENEIDTMWSILYSETENLFYAVAYDISSRRELERMKIEFLSLLTHDLRTPLTTIQATAVLLESNAFGQMPESAQSCIAEIKQETKCILELVNDLLDLAKLEAGELKADLNEISVAELVQKTREILSADKIYLASYAIPEEIRITADIDRLASAMAGLALELFSGQKDIFLQLADTEAGGLSLTITGAYTADTEQAIESINSTQASRYGTKSTQRLRLPLSKKLLQLHKGTARASLAQDENEQICKLEIYFQSGRDARDPGASEPQLTRSSV